MILPGRASQALAVVLGRELDVPVGEIHRERFPDGELLVTLPPDVGSEVVIVASTVSDESFIELLLLQDAAREAGATTLTTVVPYLGYARQDEAFDPGQPVSARAAARAIGAGTDTVVTVDPHEDDVLEHFPCEARGVSAARQLAEPLPDDLSDPVFLAPDAGARELAETVRDAYGVGAVDHFTKVRHSGADVDVSPSDATVAGRDVVVVDDIIATGGTMSQAVELLRERDAGRVVVSCVHPLLTANARVALATAGVDAIYGTDTIERPESHVSAAPSVAAALPNGTAGG